MLAALLCNLGSTPPPPASPCFMGGPIRRKYYYEDDEEESEAEIVEKEVVEPVEAVRVKPEPIVLDAQRIYERVYRETKGIERGRVTEMRRAEIERRREEEALMVFLLSL